MSSHPLEAHVKHAEDSRRRELLLKRREFTQTFLTCVLQFVTFNRCVTAERTSSFGALALVGPCSIGRAARITRRQLQPGSDCLRAAADGGLVIDPSGPERVINSGGPHTRFSQWLSAVRKKLRRKFRKIPARASNATMPPTHAPREPGDTARTGTRWNQAGVLFAFAALFVLGMAVQHRAEIVNWPVLVAALAGRVPEAQPVQAKSAAPATAAATTESLSQQTSPITKPLIPTPIPGRPLRELPDPLPGPEASLLSQRPGTAAHRSASHTVRAQDPPSEDDEEAVSVELRGRADQPTQKADDPVDVTLASPKPPASTAPSATTPAKATFKAVTVNGGALVVRGAAGKFQQVAPGEHLPNGQTLTRINEVDGTFTTNAGTFNFGEFN